MEIKEQEVKFNLDELVVISGLLAGHRMLVVTSVPDNHWNVLQTLHVKLAKALVAMTDEINKKGGSNGSR